MRKMNYKSKIHLKPLTKSDMRLLIKWRNSEEIFPYNTQYFLLNYKIQEEWFNNLRNDVSRKMFIVLFGKKKIGVCGLIHIDKKNKNADIAIIIGDTKFHSKGLGTIILSKLLEYGFKKFQLHRIGAEVFEFNEKSNNLFKKLNFKTEAVFRDAIWRKNQWWNIISLYILKDDFYKK